jgi:soluble lytic murein transglycosylase-like protein
MTSQQPKGTKARASRKRLAALGTAGVLAIGLGSNLLAAGAQVAAPVAGQPVAAPPTTVAAEPAAADAGATSPPATDPAPTAPPATPATDPPAPTTSDTTGTTADPGGAPSTPPATTPYGGTPAGTGSGGGTGTGSGGATTTTPTTGGGGGDGATADAPPTATTAPPAAAAPATAPAGATPATKPDPKLATAGKTKARLPLTGFAGPAELPAKAENAVDPDRTAQDVTAPPLRNDQGLPTVTNPTTSLVLPGPVPVGVPNFFIDKFRIPPFLLPIYQAAGIEYGVRWEVLAAINEIETDYGRNLNISSAGALGWMQFMPQTWQIYGTDANHDGTKDPFNPVDAIFAAARYLKAAGADKNLRRAIFAYNHADWYVESVLMRARLIGGLPADLVGSLSGLTQGHFPVFARARYADDIAERTAATRVAAGHNAALPVDADATRRGIDIFADAGSPVIAVQDGEITGIGETARLGRFIRLRDAYGNTYTYAHLRRLATRVPVPKHKTQSKASIARELALPTGKHDPKPTGPASAGTQPAASTATTIAAAAADHVTDPATGERITKERLFAHPARRRALTHGGDQQLFRLESAFRADESLRSYFTGVYGLDKNDVVLKRLIVGRKVIAGTILGRVGRTSETSSPHMYFEIRPAGRGAPRIDPKPILDGWKLLESTALYRAQGRNAFADGSTGASIGQILLMSKEDLAQRVLSNPRIEIYSCGRRDIEAGIVDRRVLATLEFLAASGLKPTVTSLVCGHGFYTASGNVSEHSSGNAVDIAAINGIPILGHQGAGSIADITVRRLLTLQGTIKPHQIISLMTYQDTDNTLALPDHADHIHVGFHPPYEPGTADANELDAVLKPTQWVKLIGRIGEIANPHVSLKPSKYAIRVPIERASAVHKGE